MRIDAVARHRAVEPFNHDDLAIAVAGIAELQGEVDQGLLEGRDANRADHGEAQVRVGGAARSGSSRRRHRRVCRRLRHPPRAKGRQLPGTGAARPSHSRSVRPGTCAPGSACPSARRSRPASACPVNRCIPRQRSGREPMSPSWAALAVPADTSVRCYASAALRPGVWMPRRLDRPHPAGADSRFIVHV